MAGRTLVLFKCTGHRNIVDTSLLFKCTGHRNIVDTSLSNGTTISSLSNKINIQTHKRFKRTLRQKNGIDNTMQIFREIPFLSLLIIT